MCDQHSVSSHSTPERPVDEQSKSERAIFEQNNLERSAIEANKPSTTTIDQGPTFEQYEYGSLDGPVINPTIEQNSPFANTTVEQGVSISFTSEGSNINPPGGLSISLECPMTFNESAPGHQVPAAINIELVSTTEQNIIESPLVTQNTRERSAIVPYIPAIQQVPAVDTEGSIIDQSSFEQRIPTNEQVTCEGHSSSIVNPSIDLELSVVEPSTHGDDLTTDQTIECASRLVIGGHNSPDVQAIGHQTSPESLAIGQQTSPESLAIGQQTSPEISAIGQQTSPEISAIEQQTNSEVSAIGHQTSPESLAIGHQTSPEISAIGHQTSPEISAIGHQTSPVVSAIGHQTSLGGLTVDQGHHDRQLEEPPMKEQISVEEPNQHVVQDSNTWAMSLEAAMEPLLPCDSVDSDKPAPFDHITENLYLTDRVTSREGKRAKRMVCDCQFDPEMDDPSEACSENCLNRVLMIECGSRCPCGEYCNNRRFQRSLYADVEVFRTELKGWGLQATRDIPSDTFVMEYCGEVCTPEEFEHRKMEYRIEKRRHYYFMSLHTDEILDATRKGNYSRYINHSCDPNCETQKWTVNGKLRVGFFTVRPVSSGEELTFDYKFQRFGEAAQKCYCGSSNCRGFLGGTKQSGLLVEGGGVSSPSGQGEGKRRGKWRGDVDSVFERQVYDVAGSSWKLKEAAQVLPYSHLMLQAETLTQRAMLLRVLQNTDDLSCLRRFLALHGLRLLWSWMVELTDTTSKHVIEIRLQVLHTLGHLPIANKNMLNENKILTTVKKWAEPKVIPVHQSDCQQHHEESPGVTVREADCSDGGLSSSKEEEDMITEDAAGVQLCEAEARETEDNADAVCSVEEEEEVISLATELISKWNSLKDVFRIPKKARQPLKPNPPVVTPPPVSATAPKPVTTPPPPSERRSGKRVSRWDSDEGPLPPSKQTHHDHSSQPSAARRVDYSNTSRRQHYHQSVLGPPPQAAPLPPVQNTVIVQQSPAGHHSVYVQQHLFTGPLHTTQYLPPPQPLSTASTQPLLIHQSTMPVPTASTQPLLAVQAGPAGLLHYPATGPSPLLPPPTAANIVGGITAYQPPPPPAAEEAGLPVGWKCARDQTGKVYYYHMHTMKTQWDRPVDTTPPPLVEQGESMMDLDTPEHSPDHEEPSNDDKCQPHTPDGSPPALSPTPSLAVPGSDQSSHSSPDYEEVASSDHQSTKKHHSKKDQFRHALSRVIIRCLDHHRKPDCKYGRITCSADFKYLARKLTHGITEKEVGRKGEKRIVFSASVKSRTKEYIHSYMKKFGPVFKRT